MKTILLSFALMFTAVLTYAGGTPAVIFKNFKGVVNEQQIDLSWATMMESGVNYYEIQRSGDGMNFLDIDQIESKMTISTNDFQLNYQYADAHPLPGTSFYRIQIVVRMDQSIRLRLSKSLIVLLPEQEFIQL